MCQVLENNYSLTHQGFFCSNRVVNIPNVFDAVKLWFSDWRSYIAEFLGTFLFVLITGGTTIANFLYGDIKTLGLALTIGFSYTALLFATVHIGGGYLNPAVTIALWLVKKLEGAKALFFLIAQILASFAAGGVLLLIFGGTAKQVFLGAPALGVNVDITTAVLVEAILTAGLVFAVFSTMVDRRGPVSFGPITLGLFTVAATILALPITGAGFNPARSIGPAVLSNSTNSLAVFIIGPLAGSLFALVYEVVFLRKHKK